MCINFLLLVLTSSNTSFFKLKKKKKIYRKKFNIKGFSVKLRNKQLFLFLDNFINIFLISDDWFDFSKSFVCKKNIKYKSSFTFNLPEIFTDNILTNFLIERSVIYTNLIKNSKFELFLYFKNKYWIYNVNFLRFLQFPLNLK